MRKNLDSSEIQGDKSDIEAILKNLEQELELQESKESYVPPKPDQVTKGIYNKQKKDNDIIQQDQNERSLAQSSNLINIPAESKKKYTIKIKNLDTGQEEEIQNQQQQEQFTKKNTSNIQLIQRPSIKNQFNSFWQNLAVNNQKLRFYCEAGMYEQAKKIIQKGQNGYPVRIDYKGLAQWRPIHYASYKGHDDIVEMLLQHKADVNVTTKFQRNSLHISTLRGHLSVVKKLCQYKIDINAVDQDGNTALHFACSNGARDIVEYLLSIYCTIKKNKEGVTPIQDCCDKSLKDMFKKYGFQESRKYQEFDEGQFNQLKIQMILQNNQKLTTEQFIYYRSLEKGPFGQVFLVQKRNTGSKLYAMKVLNKERVMNKNLKRYAMTERNVLSAINHPFMAKLCFAFQSPTKLFLVMDYYSGGNLEKVLLRRKTLPQTEAKKYLCEIILALQTLHKNMIVFRNLKPDNVLIDSQGHCKLTDFILSKEGIYNNTTDSFCGLGAYLAPEILLKQGHSRTVDWYYVGVLLYQLIVGIPPYYNPKKQMIFDNIKQGPLKIPKDMSTNAKDLIKKLLSRDPSKRLGATRDADQIKQHPFFQNVDWKEVLDRKVQMPPIQEVNYNLKDTIKVNFNSQGQKQEKLNGWSFVNNL